MDPNISLPLDFECILVLHKPRYCAIIFNFSAVHVLVLTASKIIVHQNVKQSMEGVLKEEDSITVWFWIRSSLPKRAWKQCMEFKETNDAGKMETWRVEDGVKRKVW